MKKIDLFRWSNQLASCGLCNSAWNVLDAIKLTYLNNSFSDETKISSDLLFTLNIHYDKCEVYTQKNTPVPPSLSVVKRRENWGNKENQILKRPPIKYRWVSPQESFQALQFFKKNNAYVKYLTMDRFCKHLVLFIFLQS